MGNLIHRMSVINTRIANAEANYARRYREWSEAYMDHLQQKLPVDLIGTDDEEEWYLVFEKRARTLLDEFVEVRN